MIYKLTFSLYLNERSYRVMIFHSLLDLERFAKTTSLFNRKANDLSYVELTIFKTEKENVLVDTFYFDYRRDDDDARTIHSQSQFQDFINRQMGLCL